jgi:hypothetical protein
MIDPVVHPMQVIPAIWFAAPYVVVDLMLLGAVILGIAIGLLAAWGRAGTKGRLWRVYQYLMTIRV